ncbi:MAG: AmmeMemoRadiSam system protein B [Planctomycetota bacterium]|jgi:AmmeMemoRadiSam system protein B
MTIPLRPKLRSLEILPVGPKDGLLFTLRDPEGFGQMVVMPYGAVVLAALMDGQHTLSEIQAAFQQQTGASAPLADVEQVIRRLDDAYLLAGQRFDDYRREQIEAYLSCPVRPPSHAGGAYAEEPEALREQLAEFFACDEGPGVIGPQPVAEGPQLCGIVSPHIDLRRGGATYAWAYKQVVERAKSDLFVIFGTAHTPMEQQFCASRKDFDTPLGVVRTDRQFIDRLARHLASSVAGQQVDLFADELVHRFEHSIEFQATFLQYVLGGRREFRVVPVLAGSFQEFLSDTVQPDESPEVQAFLAGLRAAADQHEGEVCYISGADFAHIGQRFGDRWLLDEKRLAEQSAEDHRLLEAVCRCDSAALFSQVAQQDDRSRICGLSPTYVMLKLMGSARGELLKYDQAVEPDGTSCVSFASVAFYRE